MGMNVPVEIERRIGLLKAIFGFNTLEVVYLFIIITNNYV